MCPDTFSRLARSLATICSFARLRIQMSRAIAGESLQLRASTFLLFYKIMAYSIRSNAIRGVPSGT